MQYPNEHTPLQGALRSAALAVQRHTPHPDTHSSQGEEKKWNRFGIIVRDYAAGADSHSAAKELCLILLFSLLCWSPRYLQGRVQRESTFGSLSQAWNSNPYLNPGHTALLWIHNTAQYFAHFVT